MVTARTIMRPERPHGGATAPAEGSFTRVENGHP